MADTDPDGTQKVWTERVKIGGVISEDRPNELAEKHYYFAGTMTGRMGNDPPEGMNYYVFNLKS